MCDSLVMCDATIARSDFSGLRTRFSSGGPSSPGTKNLAGLAQSLAESKDWANIWIGYDAIIETSRPDLVTIAERTCPVRIRTTVIAHFREQLGVVIEEDTTVGAGPSSYPT